MDEKVKKALNITGNDFSWMKENNNATEHADSFDANIRIALRLRCCMKERGWNQKQLAKVLGVSPQYVNKLLRNQEPTFSVKVASEYGRKLNYPLIKVCDDYDCARDYLWDDSPLAFDVLLRPSDVWVIDMSIFNGFNLHKGFYRNIKEKKVRSEKVDLTFA